jgi:hypothetical protein
MIQSRRHTQTVLLDLAFGLSVGRSDENYAKKKLDSGWIALWEGGRIVT